MAGSAVVAVAKGVTGCSGGQLSEMQVADEHLSLLSPLNGKLQFPRPASLPVPFTLLLHNKTRVFCWFI